MKLKKTTVAIAIHRPDESPIFGENTTTVSLDDEGGGEFVTLRQTDEHARPGEVRIDKTEIDMVADAARELLKQESE